jgi:ubiquinone/menaquinone biosynthesis C-methylase UbiE
MTDAPQVTSHALANQTHFDRWSKNYADGRISRWFQYTQQLSTSVLELKPDSTVLDVGCGTGFAVRYLASRLTQGKVCGIDISSGMIERAQAAIPEDLRHKVEFLQASSDDIPYPSAEFDHLLCTNSFHHYPDPPRALAEMRRVIKPGGQLVIFENAPDLSWYTWAWDRILRIVEKGHVRYYASRELGAMLRRADFERVRLCHLRNEFLKYGKLFASIQVWSCYKPR